MSRALLALFFAITALSAAHAKPEFWDLYRATYKLKAGSAGMKMKCMTCHTNPPRRNDYGRELGKLVSQSNDEKLTVAMLKAVEKKDSDKDGFTNLQEIKVGTNPGDAKSKPTKKAESDIVAGIAPDEPGTPTVQPLIPVHSFHPALVHFPVGVLIFGSAIDVLGIIKLNAEMREAGKWGIAFGSLASLAAIATGIIFWLRSGQALEGQLLTHLLFGVGASILAIGLAVWRWRREPTTKPYIAFALAAAAFMGYTGHLGAQMVWG